METNEEKYLRLNPKGHVTINANFMNTHSDWPLNKIIIFSIIWGFSQDGLSEYSGSIKYLQSWIHSSRRTVERILSELVEQQAIYKKKIERQGIVVNCYICNQNFINADLTQEELNAQEKETKLLRKFYSEIKR